MKPFVTLAALTALAIAPGAIASDAWIHVDIQDNSEGEEETVKVNFPLSMIERLLPTIQDQHIKDGKLKLDFTDDDAGLPREVDLKAIMRALRDTPDGDFVKIRDREDNVSVSKAGDYLLINADSRGEKAEKVRVRMPLDIVDAVTQGAGNDLDLVALMRALSRHSGEDLVTVEDGETRIRIWIDSKMESR